MLYRSAEFHAFLLNLGEMGYLSVFLGGILFVLTFTVASGILILITLADVLPILPLALVAALGSVLGDFIIFNFVRDNFKKAKPLKTRGILSTKYFRWTLPVIGAIIIASPLPDELGVSLLGISKMKANHFILLSFVLNFIGIFFVVFLASFLR